MRSSTKWNGTKICSYAEAVQLHQLLMISTRYRCWIAFYLVGSARRISWEDSYTPAFLHDTVLASEGYNICFPPFYTIVKVVEILLVAVHRKIACTLKQAKALQLTLARRQKNSPVIWKIAFLKRRILTNFNFFLNREVTGLILSRILSKKLYNFNICWWWCPYGIVVRSKRISIFLASMWCDVMRRQLFHVNRLSSTNLIYLHDVLGSKGYSISSINHMFSLFNNNINI
jgi:hypothetical protein